MKTAAITIVTLCALLDLHAAGGLAAGEMGPGRGPHWGGRMYDPKTVETIAGEVVRVDRIPGNSWGRGRRGGGYGLHLVLKTDKEEIPVHLGPGWYVEKQGLDIAPKDRVEVRGSRITFEGKPAIIAAAVKKGEQELRLRDESGAPAWRGGARR